MAVPIGVNTVTAIARQYILPQITDNIYSSNVVLYRLLQGNKKMIQGGTQIEVPLLYSRFAAGGAYSGFDVLNTTPSDTVKNAAFDWKQYHVPIAVDGLTLIKTDSPEAIANYLVMQSQQASMEMAELLAVGLFQDGVTLTKELDGITGLVGTGTTVGNATYGGVGRVANTWWNSGVQGAGGASTLSMTALNGAFMAATKGGQHPTLILSQTDQYNRFWALNIASPNQVNYPRQPMGHDELLASAGFTNMLFNNVPWVVDSHVDMGNVATTNSKIYMLNENFINLVVSPRADFFMDDFVKPTNQDAMVAMLYWAGNLTATNSAAQGGLFNVNA